MSEVDTNVFAWTDGVKSRIVEGDPQAYPHVVLCNIVDTDLYEVRVDGTRIAFGPEAHLDAYQVWIDTCRERIATDISDRARESDAFLRKMLAAQMEIGRAVAKLCGAVHPSWPGCRCERFAGHGGAHVRRRPPGIPREWRTDMTTGDTVEGVTVSAPYTPCEVIHAATGQRCVREPDHDGRHLSEVGEWDIERRCRAFRLGDAGRSSVRCELLEGHPEWHEGDGARWDDEESVAGCPSTFTSDGHAHECILATGHTGDHYSGRGAWSPEEADVVMVDTSDPEAHLELGFDEDRLSTFDPNKPTPPGTSEPTPPAQGTLDDPAHTSLAFFGDAIATAIRNHIPTMVVVAPDEHNDPDTVHLRLVGPIGYRYRLELRPDGIDRDTWDAALERGREYLADHGLEITIPPGVDIHDITVACATGHHGEACGGIIARGSTTVPERPCLCPCHDDEPGTWVACGAGAVIIGHRVVKCPLAVDPGPHEHRVTPRGQIGVVIRGVGR